MMLDIADSMIVQKLAGRHLYPFAQNIYHDIFKAFSHFPLHISQIGIKLPGQTITFMAWVVNECFTQPHNDFLSLFYNTLDLMSEKAKPYLFQDITIETYLGCILFFYHPSDIKNALGNHHLKKLNFTEKELYEYDVKKKTLLLFAL